MTTTSCPTCELADMYLETGSRDIEGMAAAIGRPVPSVLAHLKDHGHPGLPGLTYGWSAIIATSDTSVDSYIEQAHQTARNLAAVVPPPPGLVDQPEETATAPLGPDTHGGVDEQPTDETPGGADELEHSGDAHCPVCFGTCAFRVVSEPTGLPEVADLSAQGPAWSDKYMFDVIAVIDWLAGQHPDEEIRAEADLLADLLGAYRRDAAARAELEQLTVQRDHLTARIDALHAQLEGTAPPAEPDTPDPTPEPIHPAGSAADVRAWCHANNVPVSSTGRIGRDSIAAYTAAHGGAR